MKMRNIQQALTEIYIRLRAIERKANIKTKPSDVELHLVPDDEDKPDTKPEK